MVTLTPLLTVHQEVGFFDTEASSGKVMGALAEDCAAIQTAMSEKARLQPGAHSTLFFSLFSSLFAWPALRPSSCATRWGPWGPSARWHIHRRHDHWYACPVKLPSRTAMPASLGSRPFCGLHRAAMLIFTKIQRL